MRARAVARQPAQRLTAGRMGGRQAAETRRAIAVGSLQPESEPGDALEQGLRLTGGGGEDGAAEEERWSDGSAGSSGDEGSGGRGVGLGGDSDSDGGAGEDPGGVAAAATAALLVRAEPTARNVAAARVGLACGGTPPPPPPSRNRGARACAARAA